MLLFATAVSGSAFGSSWSDLNTASSLRAAVFEKDRDASSEDPAYPLAAWFSMKPEVSGYSFFLEGRVTSAEGPDELREAYLEKSWGNWDLKLGRQITVWGRADKINPTDQLSTRDLRILAVDDEDQRLGLGAVQVAYNYGNTRFLSLWQYEWRAPGFPLPADLNVIAERPNHPSDQYAFKIDNTGGTFDWSLSWQQTYSRLPGIHLRNIGPQGPEIGLRFDRVQTLGGDIAFNALGLGWRGEIARTRGEDSESKDPTRLNDMTFAVFGADWTFWESANLNLQLFARDTEMDKGESLPMLRILAETQNSLAQQTRKYADGASLRFSYKALQDSLETEVAAVWNRQDGDRIWRPKLSYAWTDHWRTTIGAEFFRGPDKSYYGQLKDYSGAFGELRYSF